MTNQVVKYQVNIALTEKKKEYIAKNIFQSQTVDTAGGNILILNYE